MRPHIKGICIWGDGHSVSEGHSIPVLLACFMASNLLDSWWATIGAEITNLGAGKAAAWPKHGCRTFTIQFCRFGPTNFLVAVALVAPVAAPVAAPTYTGAEA